MAGRACFTAGPPESSLVCHLPEWLGELLTESDLSALRSHPGDARVWTYFLFNAASTELGRMLSRLRVNEALAQETTRVNSLKGLVAALRAAHMGPSSVTDAAVEFQQATHRMLLELETDIAETEHWLADAH
jgi:hypothetical protein